MSLPDVSRFLSFGADRWRALGARLRAIGVDGAFDAIDAVGGRVFPPLAAPLRRWHLRRMGSAAGDALRLLAVDEPIAEEAARAALGSDLFDDLAGIGLFARVDGGLVRAALALWRLEGVLYFADDLGRGGDAVMGPGVLTAALLQMTSEASGASALELGCGAAVTAIYLSRRFERVVATDVNPRAIVLATVNAALNDAANVEVRAGDLYAPVAGERFDLVVCQPPFVPKPDAAADATYKYGGRRGDELPLRMIGGLPAHLGARGRGLVVMEWPIFADDLAIVERVRAVMPEGADALVLEAEGPDLDSYAAADASFEHPRLGAEFARAAVERREHLDRLGVQAIRTAVAVIGSRPEGRGWTSSVELTELTLDAAELDRAVAAASLLAADRAALLAARLRPATGVRFAVGEDGAMVVFPPGSPRKPLILNPGAHRVVTLLEGAPTVQAAVNGFREEGNYRPMDALDRFLPAVEQLLRAGVIEIA